MSRLTSNSFPNNEHDALNAAGKKAREGESTVSLFIKSNFYCLRWCFIEFY